IIKPGTDVEAFNKKIFDLVRTKTEGKASHRSPFIVKFSDQYLHGRYENGQLVGGRIEYVKMFSIIAVFILLIACINFMNLSTARASRKAKEVGIKKSVGAGRYSLIFQFMSESIITSLLSLIIALAVVWLFLPQFNIITDKRIGLNLTDPILFLSFFGISLFTGLLAGSYPALYLSGFK